MARVGVNDKNIEILYSEHFVDVDSHRFPMFSEKYEKRNGFYCRGKIVLTDFIKVAEYDLETNLYTEYDYEEYTFPENVASVESDNKKLMLYNHRKGEEILLSKDFFSENNNVADIILSRFNHKIMAGMMATEYFIDSVQINGDKVYIICRVLDFSGDTHAVCFEYDVETSQIMYYFTFETSDVISEHEFYILP